MYTQCPHCQTLFRISAEQLKAAAGKAHCCRCDRVFSALDNLREPQPDDSWPESRFIHDAEDVDTGLPIQHNLELPFETPDPDVSRQEIQSSLTELLQTLQINPETEPPETDQTADDEQLAVDDDRDPFEPIYLFNDPAMDSVQIGLDSRLHDTIEPAPDTENTTPTPQRDEAENTTPQHEAPETQAVGLTLDDTPPAPFDIPDNLPDIQPTDTPPLSLEESLDADSHGTKGTFGWSVAILLLLLVALSQLAWFGRDHLLRYPAGRELLESACNLLLCQLPPRHEPDKLQVVSRAITSHAQKADALSVMLTLRNDSDYTQAWPQLELSLLDSDGNLVSRRSFRPDQYRDKARGELQPGIPETIHLELADPGDRVVGFEFNFR